MNAHLKIPGIVAGMLAGADSIDDLDVCATVGWVSCSAGSGHPPARVVPARVRLGQRAPARDRVPAAGRRLGRRDPAAGRRHGDGASGHHSTQRRVYGHAKAGAGFGAAKVGATRCGCAGSTRCSLRCPPRRVRRCWSAPGCAADRELARGAESFVAEAITTARAAGSPAAVARWTPRSTAAPRSRRVAAPACGSRSPPGWTRRSPRRSRRSPRTPGHRSATRTRSSTKTSTWISDAEVAEIVYTAFYQQQEASCDRPADRAPGPPPRPTQPG